MTPILILASIAFVALSVTDLLQTLKLQKLGAVENNPLLGKHPKPAVLIAFATVTTTLWLAAAVYLVLASAALPLGPDRTATFGGACFVFALGIALRIKTVVNSAKLRKELEA